MHWLKQTVVAHKKSLSWTATKAYLVHQGVFTGFTGMNRKKVLTNKGIFRLLIQNSKKWHKKDLGRF
jgi:hypothetical protein